MAYNHWFVSRQKRQLTTILQALVAFSDVCVGKVWNPELQLVFEDTLGSRDITEHGNLRARRSREGGGGIRTLLQVTDQILPAFSLPPQTYLSQYC